MRPAVLILTGILAGCAGLHERREGISPAMGDTKAQVLAAQAINPWPKKAYRKTWVRPFWLLPPPTPLAEEASGTVDE